MNKSEAGNFNSVEMEPLPGEQAADFFEKADGFIKNQGKATTPSKFKNLSRLSLLALAPALYPERATAQQTASIAVPLEKGKTGVSVLTSAIGGEVPANYSNIASIFGGPKMKIGKLGGPSEYWAGVGSFTLSQDGKTTAQISPFGAFHWQLHEGKKWVPDISSFNVASYNVNHKNPDHNLYITCAAIASAPNELKEILHLKKKDRNWEITPYASVGQSDVTGKDPQNYFTSGGAITFGKDSQHTIYAEHSRMQGANIVTFAYGNTKVLEALTEKAKKLRHK